MLALASVDLGRFSSRITSFFLVLVASERFSVPPRDDSPSTLPLSALL